MKKMNKKGFMLAETIAVSVVVIGALIIIYSQFININRSYQASFTYNTIDKLYATKNIVDYINKEGLNNLTNHLSSSYIDITSCSSQYFVETTYCQDLLKFLNVKTVIFTKEDTTQLKQELKNNNPFSQKFYNFIQKFKTDGENRYRIFVEFNDETYATLKIGEKLPSMVYEIGKPVYFNPISNARCSEREYTETNSLTGNKIGCMKWYMYGIDENNVKLLLDHNTTAMFQFSKSNINETTMISELNNQLNEDTSNWQVEAALIKANDIATILGKQDWKPGDEYFYFDTGTTTVPSPFTGKYGWLSDRTSIDCETRGCSHNADVETNGYWTQTVNSSCDACVYQVVADSLSYGSASDANANSFGIRPVITIPKSKLS